MIETQLLKIRTKKETIEPQRYKLRTKWAEKIMWCLHYLKVSLESIWTQNGIKKLLNMLNHVYLNHHWNHLLYVFIYWSSIMYNCPQEPWQYQSVFVALPRHESLCNLSTAIVKILLKMLHKINALVRHFVWQGIGWRSLICIMYACN